MIRAVHRQYIILRAYVYSKSFLSNFTTFLYTRWCAFQRIYTDNHCGYKNGHSGPYQNPFQHFPSPVCSLISIYIEPVPKCFIISANSHWNCCKNTTKIWKKDLTDGAFYSIIVPVE